MKWRAVASTVVISVGILVEIATLVAAVWFGHQMWLLRTMGIPAIDLSIYGIP